MNEFPEYLLTLQTYVRLFLQKIHPDRHHGFHDIQKINASVTSIVNELFKFKNIPIVENSKSHDLTFFIWKSNAEEHAKISYKLLYKFPFDHLSTKSALGLFKTAGIEVDSKILDLLPNDLKPSPKFEKSINSLIIEDIKDSCFDLEHEYTKFDIDEVRKFLRIRPYIQFESSLSDKITDILRVCNNLYHIVHRMERRLGPKMPLIIISDRFNISHYNNGIMHISLSATFNGI